jgi:hypothetical protein
VNSETLFSYGSRVKDCSNVMDASETFDSGLKKIYLNWKQDYFIMTKFNI